MKVIQGKLQFKTIYIISNRLNLVLRLKLNYASIRMLCGVSVCSQTHISIGGQRGKRNERIGENHE